MYTRKENSDDAAISQLNQAKIAVEVRAHNLDSRTLKADVEDRSLRYIVPGLDGARSDHLVVEPY
jgi:hypothetical protein